MPRKKITSAPIRSFILKMSVSFHSILKREAVKTKQTLSDYLVNIIKGHKKIKKEFNCKNFELMQGNKMFNLRLPSDLHTEIKIEAIKANTQINTYILAVIAGR